MNPADRTRHIEAVVEQERIQAVQNAKRERGRVIDHAVQHGMLQSTSTVAALLNARIEAAERVLQKRIAVEKEILAVERESAPPDWRATLEGDVRAHITQIRMDLGRALRDDVVELYGRDDLQIVGFVQPEIERSAARLTGYYLREVHVLQGNFTLDAERHAREARVAMGNVTINIHCATVGALNLGTVIGDIQANLSVLKAGGQDRVVEALKRLAEEIGDAQELGEARRDSLEQVAAISAEAEKPPAQRKPGVVRGLLGALHATLSASANLIKVWEFAGPTIKAYFGL